MKSHAFVRAAAVLAAAGVSCAVPPDRATVEVVLPHTPTSWEAAWGPAQFTLEIVAPPGTCFPLPAALPPGSAVVVEVPRTAPVAVLAHPAWPEGGPAFAPGERFAPAGALWPLDLEDGPGGRTLRLGFATGPGAWVRARCLESAIDDRGFNYARLQHEIDVRLPNDPWALDVGRLLAAIRDRSVRATYIRPVETVLVRLPLPDGLWFTESPFPAPRSGGQEVGPRPVGVSTLFGADGSRLIVEVDEHGRVWLAESAPAATTGGGEPPY